MILQRLDPQRSDHRPLTGPQASLAAFASHTFPGYQTAEHIRILCEALERAVTTPNSRLIVTMPPRHSKSVHVSETLPAYVLGRFPDKRIIAASHTASLAYTFSRRVRNKIGDPRWPFPGVAVADDKGAVQAWDIAGTRGGYIAVGVGGSPVGHGADVISIDDPIRSAADADSQTVRDALWEWYQGTLRTRLQPGGSIIITATRWHTDDLTGRLLDAEKHGGEQWEHLHMPAISDDGHALWPGYWTVDALEKIRQSVGTRVWESQYQGRPVAQEGGILKRHWFPTYQHRPYNAAIIQSWDTAFKDGVSNDYSVCSTIAYTNVGRYLLDVYRERLEFPDLERMVAQKFGQWRPEAVLVEDKASGQSLIQTLRRENARVVPHEAMNIIPITVPNVRDWKIVRVNELSPMIEAGRVHIPEAASWLEDALHELTSFPLAAHDDIVDSVMQGLRWIETHTTTGGATLSSWLPDDDDDDDRRSW